MAASMDGGHVSTRASTRLPTCGLFSAAVCSFTVLRCAVLCCAALCCAALCCGRARTSSVTSATFLPTAGLGAEELRGALGEAPNLASAFCSTW
jgi:hypothetical protein